MRRIIVITLLALTATGGVASADRGYYRGGHVHRAYPRSAYHHHGVGHRNYGHYGAYGHYGRHAGHYGYGHRYYGNRYVYGRPYGYGVGVYAGIGAGVYGGYGAGVYAGYGAGVYGGYGAGVYLRPPIYVQRPYIAHRYYNYYQRPAVIVENYPARAGYLWVAGRWTWNGYEWIWQPGYYQPAPSYGGYPYAPSTYDATYYNSGSYY